MKFVAGYFWTQVQTTVHKFWVAWYMLKLYSAIRNEVSWKNWFWRAFRHDWTKYKWDEASGFAKAIFELPKYVYGSPEAKALGRQISPTIELHKSRWDHHPEFWDGGYTSMSRIAKFELICDWAAAIRRGKDGNLAHSIEINAKRFHYKERDKEFLRAYGRILGVM